MVDDKAVEGDNEIILRYRVGDGGLVELDPFVVDIQTTADAIISILGIETDPEIIVPGGQADIIISVRNIDDALLRDIALKLDLRNVPLAPVGSSNEITVKSIGPGKDATLTFHIAAEPEAEANLYKIPMFFTYQDELGTKFTRNNTFGIRVGDKPDLVTTLDETEIIKKGDKVVVMPYVSCGECIACRNGKTNCCTNIKVLGVHTDGGMQEQITVPTNILLPANNLSDDQMAIVEPLALEHMLLEEQRLFQEKLLLL